MKTVLTATIILALIFGLLNVLLSKDRKRGMICIFITCVTIIIGGFDLQGRAVLLGVEDLAMIKFLLP